MSVVLWRIMVLIVKGGITRRPVHHARRLSVHHVSHRRVRTVRPARTCGQWWKHYTLLRLDRCPAIGGEALEKLVGSLREASRVSFLFPSVGGEETARCEKSGSNQLCVFGLIDSRCHAFAFSLAFFFLKSDAEAMFISSFVNCDQRK
ncbi:hypothetical protein K0M31_014279 [Melipona bicolor]|uniref:Uncharacterized protein n=1 Tax=Melipona bicolor TaxID=60889 RepID=A0AA40G8G0_9HYME|nr:hypothetical protein K0M31_014279 [Melipona bicolor]